MAPLECHILHHLVLLLLLLDCWVAQCRVLAAEQVCLLVLLLQRQAHQ
jgi:hypothetical protein